MRRPPPESGDPCQYRLVPHDCRCALGSWSWGCRGLPRGQIAAMVSALAEGGRFRLFVQTDERSAAFFALGMARSLGRPVAVCVTSGSAVANLVPALCEAHAIGLPLIVLSCDRPHSMRGLGLPQTAPQLDFCAPVVAAAIDLDAPDLGQAAVAACRAAIRALEPHLAAGPDQGPVQINIPLEGKTSSVDGKHGWGDPAPARSKIRTRPAARHSENVEALTTISAWGRTPTNGLIVVGPDSHGVSIDEIRMLAAATGYPLICDAPGSVRGAGIERAVAEADFIVTRPSILRERAECVIRVGSSPVSASLQRYLADNGDRVVRINSRMVQGDFLASSFVLITAPSADNIRSLAGLLPPARPEWQALWEEEAQTCRSRLVDIMDEFAWSEITVVNAALQTSGFSFVHLANSLTLRLANLMLPISADQRSVYLNRGVSGIDGTIGTFLGELAAEQAPGLLLIGDLAAIHDIPALEACLHDRYRGAIVIINNLGAGLFDTLPVRTVPDYDRLIRNPASVNFEHIARAFGLSFTRCEDIATFTAAMRDAAVNKTLHLIEARVPEGAAPKQLLKLMARLMASKPA